MTDKPSLYGPDGYLAKFTAMCHAVKAAAAKVREDEDRRSAQYTRGFADGQRAALKAHGEPG